MYGLRNLLNGKIKPRSFRKSIVATEGETATLLMGTGLLKHQDVYFKNIKTRGVRKRGLTWISSTFPYYVAILMYSILPLHDDTIALKCSPFFGWSMVSARCSAPHPVLGSQRLPRI